MHIEKATWRKQEQKQLKNSLFGFTSLPARPICVCVCLYVYVYILYTCLPSYETDWLVVKHTMIINKSRKFCSKWRKTNTLDIYPNNLETKDKIMQQKHFWNWLTETFLPIISISPCSLFLHSFSIWRRMPEASEFNLKSYGLESLPNYFTNPS